MNVTQIKLPTSLVFAATRRRWRVQNEPEPGKPVRNMLVLMGEFDGRGLIQANALIEVGDQMYMENHAPDQPVEYKVVAAIDKDTRAATGEWLVTWAQVPSQREGEPTPAVTLDPDRFTDIMLAWAYERTGGGQSVADLADFAPGDIPAGCAMALADHLQSAGLLLRKSGSTAVSITAEGVTAAETAAAERIDQACCTEALQKGMVLWINEQSRLGHVVDLRHFLYDPRSTFHGHFFTENDLHVEHVYLAEMGLVYDDGPWWASPTLTAKGRSCAIYHGGNVRESMNPQLPQNNTIINVGSNNQNAIGDGEQKAYLPPPQSPAAGAAALPAANLPVSAPEPETRTATRWSKIRAFATTTAGVITFVCTVVIAAGTVVLCLLAIK